MSKIKEIKPSTIKRALRLHEEWLEYNDLCDPDLPKGREIVLTNEIIQKIGFINNNLFAGVNLRNLDASNLDFSGKYFFGVNFSGTNFEGANFENSNFEGLMEILLSSMLRIFVTQTSQTQILQKAVLHVQVL